MSQTQMSAGNILYYGDNLQVLRQHVADESVDLVYLDPPFNSNADYNVLFAERDGTKAHAQFEAFGDTWTWDTEAARNFDDALQNGGEQVAKAMVAFKTLLGTSDMLAYLSMMAPRLVELRRVLKPTGSIYLHCDPTASHYLKLLMDAIFGPENFRNEIVWQRTTPKGHAFTRFPSTHDVIVFYAKSDGTTWHTQYLPYREEYIASHYRQIEPETGRRYMLDNCLNPNPNRPNLTYDWHGHHRVWRWTREKMQKLDEEGRLVYTSSGMPRYKRYLDEMAGSPATSVWTDIYPINSQAQERLGYPTQKPESLLERIILASSNEGDVVLDPFCGCGTAVAVAHRLKRRWLGIDITHLAVNLIKIRLADAFGAAVAQTYRVVGEPTTAADAAQLAREEPYQFQWWALGLVGARPASGSGKKGADKGIDGRLFFHDSSDADAQVKQVILSVKAGENLNVAMVRDLVGVLDREKEMGAAMGVLISMEEPTRPMREEAAGAGFYRSPAGTQHARVQLLTVAELLDGRRIDMPAWRDVRTFKKAPRSKGKGPNQGMLGFEG